MNVVTANLLAARRLDQFANERYAKFGVKNVHVVLTSEGFLLCAGHLSAIFRTAGGLESYVRDFGSLPLVAKSDRAPCQ